MGEFNVDKTDGSLIPTAGYGGMIKINGTTLADLIAALNGMTEDQKNRCEILLYLNSENYTNFFVLKRYNENVSAYGSETHDIYSTSHDEVTIYDGKTTITHYATSLHITKLTSGTTAKISRVSGSNGYDLTSSLSSWSILYQDDSITGGNTYPASQVIMSDGETSVEDALTANTSGEGTVINQGILSTERLFWNRYGNVVVVDIDFTVGSADITVKQAELFSGFPRAFSANRSRFRCPKKDGEYQPDLVLCVTEDGKIINQWSNGGIKANAKYACSFTYIAT